MKFDKFVDLMRWRRTVDERDERWSDRDVVKELRELARLIVQQDKKLADAIEDGAEDTIRAIKASTAAIVAAIQGSAPPEKAVTAVLTYSIGGNPMGAPVSGAPGNTATPTFSEADANGVSVAPIGPVIFASDNTAIVSVDASTGIATLVAAGTANVSALDSGNGLTDSVAFTVTAVVPVATTATLNYSLNPARRR